jgi:hypothetical protein
MLATAANNAPAQNVAVPDGVEATANVSALSRTDQYFCAELNTRV